MPSLFYGKEDRSLAGQPRVFVVVRSFSLLPVERNRPCCIYYYEVPPPLNMKPPWKSAEAKRNHGRARFPRVSALRGRGVAVLLRVVLFLSLLPPPPSTPGSSGDTLWRL